MAFCTKCGAQVPEGNQFCTQCGAPIGQAAQQQNQQNQQGQPNQTFQGAANFAKGINNTADYTNQYTPQDIQEGRTMSILAYFGILFFLPLVVTPNSKYGRFHANQGLLLLIGGAALEIVQILLGLLIKATCGSYFLGVYVGLNGFGVFLTILIDLICWAPIAALVIIGIINAVNNRAKELPFIGKIRLIK